MTWASAAGTAQAAPQQRQERQEESTAQREEEAEESEHDDGRRTIARLPINFGRGLVGVFSPANALPFVFGVAATGATAILESGADRSGDDDDSLRKLGQGFGDLKYVALFAGGLLVAGRLNDGPVFRDATYDIFVAAGVNVLYTEALKRVVSRTRPDGSDDLSFPSGHTSNAFTWATVLNRHYGKKVGIPMFALASLIGVSRLTGGKHHASDVVAGAAIGIIVGLSVTRQNGVPVAGFEVELSPAIGPAGQPGVMATIRF